MIGATLFWRFDAVAAESHPGLNAEARNLEAVLAYNLQKIDEAMLILNEIIALQPDHIPSLELRALIQRNRGKDKEALVDYVHILKVKPHMECGPHYFEAAVILSRLGKADEAMTYFQAAIDRKFNVSAANMFLGMLRVRGGKNAKLAEMNFRYVLEDGLPEMKVVSNYYLGMVYLKLGNSASAKEALVKARDLGATMPENKTASDSGAAAQKLLDNFKKSMFFASLGFLTHYDSNISTTPATASSQNQVAFRATWQTAASLSVGYMTPPDAKIQYVPSYSFSYNQNYNPRTRQYQYAANTLSLYSNYRPLEIVSGGMKFSGTYTFQNVLDNPSDVEGNHTLTRYSLSGDFGPFFKWQINPRLRFEVETGLRPSLFYSTPDMNGTDYSLKFTLRSEMSSVWLAPGLSVGADWNSTRSLTFKSKSLALSLFNVMRPTSVDTLNFSFDFIDYNYYAATPVRHDLNYSPKISDVHSFGKWSVSADAAYTFNSSNLASSYTYRRFVTGLGISYSF